MIPEHIENSSPGCPAFAWLPAFSIVVPTFREAENLPALAARVDAALSGSGFQWGMVLVDDDSGDGSEKVVAKLARHLPVRMEVRRDLPRDLSLSVLHGLRIRRFDRVVVMDADLSHPPESIVDPAVSAVVGGRPGLPGDRTAHLMTALLGQPDEAGRAHLTKTRFSGPRRDTPSNVRGVYLHKSHERASAMSDRRLKAFCTVARLLSLTKAAKVLHLTQPAATFQIRQMENDYKTRLFNRTHNRITLTESAPRCTSTHSRSSSCTTSWKPR